MVNHRHGHGEILHKSWDDWLENHGKSPSVIRKSQEGLELHLAPELEWQFRVA